MDRVTPSGIAEASYQATRGRWFPDKHGLPDPHRAWKPEADPDVLGPIIRRAFDAYIEQLLPPPARDEIARQLDADLAQRFPPDEMIALGRHGFARWIDRAFVDVGAARLMGFGLPTARQVPSSRGRFDHQFTALGLGGPNVAQVPEQLLGIFEPVIEAHAHRAAEFGMAAAWPAAFHHQHKRRPTWAEIEAAWPRIGAWMAKQRET